MLTHKPLLKKIRENKVAYALIAPNMIFFTIFLLIPFFWVIILSFHKGSYLSQLTYVGFENYRKLTTNKLFYKSILNTFKYTVTIIPSVFVVSMIIALLLNGIVKFQNFFRTLLFIPLLSSIVVAAIIWRYMAYPEYGPISMVLNFFKLPSPNWFGNPKIVMFSIAMVELWRGAPFYTVTFLAGLQSVPREMVEASYIDGANYFQALFRIVFPTMKPVLTFCLVMSSIWALQLFDSVYVLTRGGPAEASSTMVWYVYKNIFFFNKVGRGATMSVILVIITAIVTYINLKITRFQEQTIYK